MKNKIVSLLGKKRELKNNEQPLRQQEESLQVQIFNKNHHNISCQSGGIPDIVA